MRIFDRIREKLSVDGAGDNFPLLNVGCSLGTVMGTDDPLQQGRIQVYCAALNDDPKKPQYLPWAAYLSPFGGSINNPEHTKGHDPDKEYSTKGTTQYGFWAIPEVGANVLITCINGDPRRRVWLGCLYEHQETGGFMHGMYEWDDGTVDGPFCGRTPNDDPTLYRADKLKGKTRPPHKIQPLYENQTEAFNDERDSAEWKTRGADYAGMVNSNIDSKGTNADLRNNEDDKWVEEKLGADGYDWTAFKNLGAYLASKVIGLMSPGFHSISLDDRPFNSRIRIRTTAGNQIILDDTNERIYVSTYEGKSWVELDKAGNIDMYGERRISIHSDKDLNLSSNETVRIKGNKGIHMYAGNSTGTPLDATPADGQIRLHSVHDTHFMTEGNMFQTTKGNMDYTLNGNFTGIVDGTYNLEIGTNEYNVITPSNKIMINGSTLQLETSALTLDGSSKVQIQGGGTRSSFSGSTIKFDASTVAFNDFGTSVGKIVSEHNKLVGEHNALVVKHVALAICANCPDPTGPASPSTPSPKVVSAISLNNPNFTVEDTEIAPWPNRVPEHEPWPRVLKIDSGDTVNDKSSDGYKDNVAWVDQFNNEGKAGRKYIGIMEGDDEIERGEFWRR
jgi:hypothetical protein